MVSEDNRTVLVGAAAISLAVIATIIGLIVFALIVCYCFRTIVNSRKERSYKNGIYFYLQKFEVDDIDLRRAPTGGWHGTYVNKLAYGVNDADSKSSSSSEDTFIIESSSEDSDDDENDVIIITSTNDDIEKGSRAVSNSRMAAEEGKFEEGKLKSLFLDATESIHYYGLSQFDNDDSMNFHDDDKVVHRPWRTTDDTI